MGLFVHRFRFRFKETGGGFIRPISIKDPFYLTTKRTVRKDLRVFLQIKLKLSKKTFRISVPKLVNAHPLRPKFFK